MTTGKIEMMAVCGLDCGGCGIRKLPFDAGAAEGVVQWYRSMGWLEEHEGVAEALERKMYCHGFHGNRVIHWSANCWILQCCVDDKGLTFCYECANFPCEKLVDWAAQNESYTQALQRLQQLKE